MGVPKFYRWISERYPKINQIVSDNALLPEVDHLYLDLNGIIHGCTHPSHMDIADRLSEREMMLGIMHYLDRLITQIAKPKVSVYMAIDGVAPRAKLNQQRSRRFRSAKDMAEATKDMDQTSQSQVFDSNCITPGTEFLEMVSHTIQYFIRKKIKEDPLWHNLTIIFSGHDIPGEGEHKIMQHIREMRSQPGYPPNTRHCIYGQDADLIMLGLVTHEPHFTILREVVDFMSFNNNNGTKTLKAVKKFTKESDFQLLHLSVLREYLQLEFCSSSDDEQSYDLERVIDDFVFMTFLVGNDFLPHMPTLDIGDGAFDLLFDIYREQRRDWETPYLTESGKFCDAARLEGFLAAIGAVETEILTQREKDEAVYIKKRRKWDKRDGKAEGPSDSELKRQEESKQGDYLTMIATLLAKQQAAATDNFVDGWEPVTEPGQKDYKGRYYYEKMKLTPVDKDEHWNLRRSYMEGLMWCLAYYYEGCISWGWYYPYHYGPMLSDLIDIPKMFNEISFEIGEPLLPFQQLMACLPPASAALVPKVYRMLMTSPESPIIQFYPQNFEVDMNGKKNPWEGVNLLPFIDVVLLKETIAKFCPRSKISDAESRRDTVGKVYCYRFDLTATGNVESPIKKLGCDDIACAHSSVTVLDPPMSSGVPFKPVLIKGTQIPYPGFPALTVIPIESVELVPVGLNCFGSPSKYPTRMLKLYRIPEYPPLETLAQNVLGQSVYVNWPLMHEGRVVAVSDNSHSIRLIKGGKRKVVVFDKAAADNWDKESTAMFTMYHTGNGVPGSGGVDIGDVIVRLRLVPLQGMTTNHANGATSKLFGREEADVPLQLALLQAPAPDPRFVPKGPLRLEDRFPERSNVVLTKGKYRGCKGIVVGVPDTKNVGVKVETIPPEVPFGLAIARTVQESYISSHDAARILKMQPGLFGKITGRLQFTQGKYDLGLNLKSADGTCVVGYTRRKVEHQPKGNGKNMWQAGDSLLVVGSPRAERNEERNEERIQWEFTPKAVRLVQEFRDKFPQLFIGLKKYPNEAKYDASQIFGPNGDAWLPVIREWLDKHETAKLPRSPITSDSMSYEAVAAVQKAADVRTLAMKKLGYPRESVVKVPGNALYRECSTNATDVLLASDLNNNEAPELGDRIVNLCADGVPFGARGTVVGIHEASTTGSVEVVMDEEFVGGSTLQGACSNFRGRLCIWAHLLKIAPDNAKGMVDKLVPKGTGKAAVDKIMSSIEREVAKGGKAEKTVADPKSVLKPEGSSLTVSLQSKKAEAESARGRTVAAAASNPEVQPPVEQRSPKPDRHRSTSRPMSAGRGRQGTWKEARGPDDKGIGFKGTRKGKSGIERWKSLVNTPEAVSSSVATEGAASAELKALLGVSSPASASTSLVQGPPNVVSDQNLQLKAMLGIAPAPEKVKNSILVPPTATSQSIGVTSSDGLKALLGVPANNRNDFAHQPVQPAVPVTAAEHLLHLMATKQQQTAPPVYRHPIPAHSAFNFNYVEEGKDLPTPPVSVAPPASSYPSMMGYHVPPQFLGMPFSSPMHQLPMHGFPIPPSPPQPVPGPSLPHPPLVSRAATAESPGLLNENDFPSLGAARSIVPPKKVTAVPTQEPALVREETVETIVTPVSSAFHFVPSVVAAKTKKSSA